MRFQEYKEGVKSSEYTIDNGNSSFAYSYPQPTHTDGQINPAKQGEKNLFIGHNSNCNGYGDTVLTVPKAKKIFGYWEAIYEVVFESDSDESLFEANITAINNVFQAGYNTLAEVNHGVDKYFLKRFFSEFVKFILKKYDADYVRFSGEVFPFEDSAIENCVAIKWEDVRNGTLEGLQKDFWERKSSLKYVSFDKTSYNSIPDVSEKRM